MNGRLSYVRQVDEQEDEQTTVCHVDQEVVIETQLQRGDIETISGTHPSIIQHHHQRLQSNESQQLQEMQTTDRSSILDDQLVVQRVTQVIGSGSDFEASYLGATTQGNLTTNPNNFNTSKIGLSAGVKTNVNKQRVLAQTKATSSKKKSSINPQQHNDKLTHQDPYDFEYPIDSKDFPLPTYDQHTGSNADHSQLVIVPQTDGIEHPSGGGGRTSKSIRMSQLKEQKQQKEQQKRKPINLQIEIPDSDEEKKARTEAYNKKKLQQQQQQQQQLQQTIQTHQQSKADPSSFQSPCPSSRVNEIIKQSQAEVENLETIQIDYDSETIEGLSDDQCLELYCEGSVKLKNSQRLQCTLAYEQHLITKIRNTTRLVYSNLHIVGSGNFSASDFIALHVVTPLKRDNMKFRSSDISEAFTVQCADYIHFSIRKNLSKSIKLFIFLALLQMIVLLLKIQDSIFDGFPILKLLAVVVTAVSCAATYSYTTGMYNCNHHSIRRAIFFNKLFLVIMFVQFLLEFFILDQLQIIITAISQVTIEQTTDEAAHGTSNGSRESTSQNEGEYYKTVVVYLVIFIASCIIPPFIASLNVKTLTSLRRIITIISNEDVS